MVGCLCASRMNGAWSRKILCAATALAFTGNASAQSITLDGHWQGAVERDGAVMTVRFDFQTGPSGSGNPESVAGIRAGDLTQVANLP